ncbi:Tfp pilus assembly protein PilF [Saccharothrix texasensis]|uniref:Tfp pilus assembly protein PilF n=2 Tax=Saccharothrix texasensis TaxID=103734 RepID=A0A3N1HH92_9PSEU|nr:Tfp pilus assembly protein PilF [Saccharothrix texasensis]
MHDLIRRYAVDTAHRSLPEQQQDTALRRLIDFYLHTAANGDRLLNPPARPLELAPPRPGCDPLSLSDEAAALTWFAAEHHCLLAAQHSAAALGMHQVTWQLAKTMTAFHYRGGHLHSNLTAWRTAAAAADESPDLVARTVSHRFLGSALSELGHHDQAFDHFRTALELARYTDDRTGQANAHRFLASAYEQRGDDRQALGHATRALELFQAIGSPTWEAIALNQVGWFTARLGDYDTAREYCTAALAVHRRHSGHRECQAKTLDSLGYIAYHTGHHFEAVVHHQQALALLRGLRHTYAAASTLDRLGHSYLATRQHSQARTAWQEALKLYRQQQRFDIAESIQRQLDSLGDSLSTTATASTEVVPDDRTPNFIPRG